MFVLYIWDIYADGNEVFEFLVSCIALAEQVPVSQMLVFGDRAGPGLAK